MSATHTPHATRCSEILIPEGIDRKGHSTCLATEYGRKTREGVADLIDIETGLPSLLAERNALQTENERLRVALEEALLTLNGCFQSTSVIASKKLVRATLAKGGRE